MRTLRRSLALITLALAAVAAQGNGPILTAQSLPVLFEPGKPGAQPKARPVRPFQTRRARLKLAAFDAPAVRLNLFDNADQIAERTRLEQQGPNRFVWHGRTDDGGTAMFAIVNGVTTGTVFLDGRAFEIFPDADGEYTIEELNAASFPTEDAPVELDGDEFDADRVPVGGGTEPSSPPPVDPDAKEIAVMVLWTPSARSAQGGQSAIESLILAAVTNANLAYSNSGLATRLTLVHSAEVAFAETPSNIAGDLTALRATADGKIDAIHTLRNEYAADVVSLIGNGYASAGYCGVGYLMSVASTSFAPNAFNVVDRSCAAGYLSFAHEVGHNQGLHHDPANASGSSSYPYAFGYQDPGNLFRTVLSYGSATRVPYLSNPLVTYNGRVTGTTSQDNARALTNTTPIVAAFRGSSTAPTCSFTVSPTSLGFASGSGSATVVVSTTEGCSWTSSSQTSWATVSGSGTGSGVATVSVTANGPTSRSATLTVAGQVVTVTQAALVCSYTVSPTTLSFASGAASATVAISTAEGCGWTSSSPVPWATVSGSGSGSGTATVAVTSNGLSSRSAVLTIAGQSVTVSQAAFVCSYTVTPASLSFTSAAGTATVAITTAKECSWTTSGSNSWVTVSGSGSGSGIATVTVKISRFARTAAITVAGQPVTVSQAGRY